MQPGTMAVHVCCVTGNLPSRAPDFVSGSLQKAATDVVDQQIVYSLHSAPLGWTAGALPVLVLAGAFEAGVSFAACRLP